MLELVRSYYMMPLASMRTMSVSHEGSIQFTYAERTGPCTMVASPTQDWETPCESVLQGFQSRPLKTTRMIGMPTTACESRVDLEVAEKAQ